jgi:hypothetical protein
MSGKERATALRHLRYYCELCPELAGLFEKALYRLEEKVVKPAGAGAKAKP